MHLSPAAFIVIPVNLLVSYGIFRLGWTMMTDKYVRMSPIAVVPFQMFGLLWIWFTGLRVMLVA